MNLKTVTTAVAAVFLASAMSAKADLGANTMLRAASASAPDAEETCLIIICCNSWRCYWKDL